MELRVIPPQYRLRVKQRLAVVEAAQRELGRGFEERIVGERAGSTSAPSKVQGSGPSTGARVLLVVQRNIGRRGAHRAGK
jgi:hypothetical protein